MTILAESSRLREFIMCLVCIAIAGSKPVLLDFVLPAL